MHHAKISYRIKISCVRPAVTNSPYHATGSARTAVGRFLLLARLSGTHCPKTFGIRSVVLTVTDSRWRHVYFCSTNVFSALEFFLRECAIQIYIWHLTDWQDQEARAWDQDHTKKETVILSLETALKAKTWFVHAASIRPWHALWTCIN